MIATIHLVAHILFVLALVASAAPFIHTNDTSYFCGSHRPSHEHGVTPLHTRLLAVGVLSLIVVLSARALRRAVSTSVWRSDSDSALASCFGEENKSCGGLKTNGLAKTGGLHARLR
ncbi:hypothetical protein B0H11DRAFT_1394651 [Mycena galericulata]|nr:hypothetical protein B0H11DRAFT_1394651 [Mycena galericulata]